MGVFLFQHVLQYGKISRFIEDRIFDVNTKSVIRAKRKALPIFLEKGKGVIVNTASTGGYNGAHVGATYTASIHAVVVFTKNIGFLCMHKKEFVVVQ